MRIKNSDILVVLGIGVLNVVWAFLPYHFWEVSLLLALPMIFFLPGYMLTEVLTHNRGLDAFHRLTFGLGLSLAIDILGGFLLNLLPMGLQAQSWTVLLSCLTLLLALVAVYLRRDIAPTYGQRNDTSPVHTFSLLSRLSISRGIIFCLAATLVVLSFFYGSRGVAEQARPGFTQLWMLPLSGKQDCTVRVGVRSFEIASVNYSVVMMVNEVQAKTWPAIVLAPNEGWEQSVAVSPTTTKHVLVEVRLYRNDKPTNVYRSVHVTLTRVDNKQRVFHCSA